MINEPGAALQGLFLDPENPLLTAQLPQTPPSPSKCWVFSIWTEHSWGQPGWDVQDSTFVGLEFSDCDGCHK